MESFRSLQSLQNGAGGVDLLPLGSRVDWLFSDARLSDKGHKPSSELRSKLGE